MRRFAPFGVLMLLLVASMLLTSTSPVPIADNPVNLTPTAEAVPYCYSCFIACRQYNRRSQECEEYGVICPAC